MKEQDSTECWEPQGLISENFFKKEIYYWAKWLNRLICQINYSNNHQSIPQGKEKPTRKEKTGQDTNSRKCQETYGWNIKPQEEQDKKTSRTKF